MIHAILQRLPPGTGYQVKKRDELRFGVLENVDKLRIVGLLMLPICNSSHYSNANRNRN